MPHTVREVDLVARSLWPLDGAEPWDAPGLVTGDPAAAVDRIHLTVDAVPDVAEEAVALGAQLLIAHHPLLLRGVTSVAEDAFAGRVIGTLVRGGCALLSAHTNADVVESGTSATFASRLGLVETRPLTSSGERTGIGRVGRLPEAITLGHLAGLVGDILPQTAGGMRVSGEYDRLVKSVALCGGAGDSFLGDAAVAGADVYITSDLRHHPASAFRETAKLSNGPALIDVSHWASEWLWLDVAAAELREALPGVVVTVSDLRTDPWDFVVVQNQPRKVSP